MSRSWAVTHSREIWKIKCQEIAFAVDATTVLKIECQCILPRICELCLAEFPMTISGKTTKITVYKNDSGCVNTISTNGSDNNGNSCSGSNRTGDEHKEYADK